MGKISPVSSKYITHARIVVDGVVDRPDVIGAIFGQTEGLLGADLELRELQRSGRIGRIEVNVNTSSGKTTGEITIPSSLDKAETAIVGAALEIIQRIGPCTANIKVQKIEDVRVAKRSFVINRAKELLRKLTDETLPDSRELADEVAQSVRVMEIKEFGKERLAAGPAIEDSDEIIVVEGRADVINLLKHGIKNSIALNGTSVPQTIKDLSKKKVITLFVDGDRGGDLIIKEMMVVSDLDFVCRAPDGKEVEEITKKEIHKALRGKIAVEQAKHDIAARTKSMERRPNPHRQTRRVERRPVSSQQRQRPTRSEPIRAAPRPIVLQAKEKEKFKKVLDDLVGTRAAIILDNKLNALGKVPVTELNSTIRSVSGSVHAIVLDGAVGEELIKTAENARVRFVVGSEIKAKSTRVKILTDSEL